MWTFLIGPFAALLPKTWRESLLLEGKIVWERATALSGLVEAVAALTALSEWYSRAMSLWVGNGISSALNGQMGPEVRVQDVGGAALLVWATHPLTWVIGYFAIEGAVRFCAGALGGTACGTLPICLVDRILFSRSRRRAAQALDTGAGARAHLSSFAGAVRERLQAPEGADGPDELYFSTSDGVEILEIHAGRRKQDWNPPRTVRYSDAYYRLEEEEARGRGARPFRYRLRRLAAGVPGRTVLQYAPQNAVISKPQTASQGSR